MTPTTPSGTRTRVGPADPLGRTLPSTTCPTGSASPATVRSPAAIEPTRCSVSRSLSSSVCDAPLPVACSTSEPLASSKPAQRILEEICRCEKRRFPVGARTHPPARAMPRPPRRPSSSSVPVTAPGYPATQAITTRSSRCTSSGAVPSGRSLERRPAHEATCAESWRTRPLANTLPSGPAISTASSA